MALSPCFKLRIATLNGATASGHLMPASSWKASMIAAIKPRRADAVGAHVDRFLDAVRAADHGLHRLGVFGAEIEDVPDLDAARRHLLVGRDRAESGGVVLLGGRGVERRPFVDMRLQTSNVIEVHVRPGTGKSR